MAIGGGSQSALWLSMLATALEVELDLPEASELGAAFGAARLAMIAATGATPAEVLRRPKIRAVVAPSAEHAASYAGAYEDWAGLTRLC